MSTQADLDKLSVQEFARRFRQEMIPLGNKLSYFSAIPLSEDDVRDYLEEPVAALPPKLPLGFAKVCLFLVPYLQKRNGRTGERVTFERPDEKNEAPSSHFTAGSDAILVFGIKGRQVADYHYIFYRAVAEIAADHLGTATLDSFSSLLRDELRGRVHGEIDEEGWNQKQALLRRQNDVRRDTKLFRNYARQSLVDTLTLYLHGICCDIDVETGPRQLPSRFLRRRLQLLHEAFPPPTGYAVFPEELKG